MKRGDLKNQQAMYRLLDKWESSGLNQKAFCRSEGLNYFTFKYWKSKRDSKVVNSSNDSKDTEPSFIPVEVSKPMPQMADTNLGAAEIQINYPNGVQVNCPFGVGFDQIKMLIQIF
jgi:hypothetical protein